MTLKRLLLASSFVLTFTAMSVVAQVTAQPAGVKTASPDTMYPRVTASPTRPVGMGMRYPTTRSVSGQIIQVNVAQGYIAIADPKRGPIKFYLNEKTRLRADKGTPLGDKKELTLADFQRGQAVKVTFWPENLRVTEVRARRPKS